MATKTVCPCCTKPFLHPQPVVSLQQLCEENRYTEVCKLVKAGSDVNIILYPSYKTPLHVAAGSGSKETLTVLLTHGANPNINDRDGHTALHEAVQSGHLEIAQILLELTAVPCECQACQLKLDQLLQGEDDEMDFERELEKLRPVLEGKLVNKQGEIIDINK